MVAVNALVIAVLGGFVGVGVLTVMAGLQGRAVVSAGGLRAGRLGTLLDQLVLRATLAIVAALAAAALTHWMVLAVVAFGVAWWSPTWWRSRGGFERELGLVEAIASWTEHIRDTLAAANGLEHAIGATAPLAPAPIAEAVGRLAARTDYEPLPDALRRFAEEVGHPMADFVVAALVIAAEREARDLGALLGTLADAARDEARMRTRVWVGRARSRSAIRIIVAVVVLFVVGLLVFNRAYLRPYDSPSGQLVLTAIIGVFGASFVAMERIGRIQMPQRFIVRRTAPLEAS
ncbi:MAG: putative integral rane protein [Ilumatobacteraceae bacterium]|nr:putative integral rane protein [Ilumatobacteraceae bacterium]